MDLNDRKNIVGISSLMIGDNLENDKYDILQLEKEIISGADINIDESKNDALEYERDLQRINNSFGIGASEKPWQEPRMDFEMPKSNYYETDTQLHSMTMEQKKQNYVDNALQDIDESNEDLENDINQEQEEDDKSGMLEQIDQLRETLDDNAVDLSNIPKVTKDNSFSDIKNIHKILRMKNDRNRYCSFAEELILSGAHGIEYLFDGKNDWLGRKPDLTGWSNTVKVKLRRCRFQTSSLVKDIMSEYNMGSGMQLMLELIPSMFLYSRQKKLSNNDTIMDDSKYNDAISQLNNENVN